MVAGVVEAWTPWYDTATASTLHATRCRCNGAVSAQSFWCCLCAPTLCSVPLSLACSRRSRNKRWKWPCASDDFSSCSTIAVYKVYISLYFTMLFFAPFGLGLWVTRVNTLWVIVFGNALCCHGWVHTCVDWYPVINRRRCIGTPVPCTYYLLLDIMELTIRSIVLLCVITRGTEVLSVAQCLWDVELGLCAQSKQLVSCTWRKSGSD